MISTSQKTYYPALTGLRALSAYMVFLFHANPFDKQGWQRPLFQFTNELHVGVSLFFVLSGFLISTRYSEEFQWSGSWIKRYLQNRFAKIYPLYFVLLITLIVITLFQSPRSSLNNGMAFTYAINFTLLQGFFNDLKFTGIMQAWSLTVEECFYLSLPLILLWQKRFSVFVLPLLLIMFGIVLVAVSPAQFYGLVTDVPFMMEYTFFWQIV